VDRSSARLRDILQELSADEVHDFQEKLLQSWIYHDNALEGIVLTHNELRCSLQQDIMIDVTLMPTFEEIRAHRAAIEVVYEYATKKRGTVDLDIIKKIYSTLTPNLGDPRLVRYRKDTPLHRLYFHEIAPPEKISYRMRRLIEWLGTAQAKNMNPLKLAAKVHFRLMHIYPFPKGSGKLARLVMNLILLRNGYQPSIIHATERQRYYDVLRSPHSGLTRLICESLLNSVDGTIRFFEEGTMQSSIPSAMAR
jgi:Fic family protein